MLGKREPWEDAHPESDEYLRGNKNENFWLILVIVLFIVVTGILNM